MCPRSLIGHGATASSLTVDYVFHEMVDYEDIDRFSFMSCINAKRKASSARRRRGPLTSQHKQGVAVSPLFVESMLQHAHVLEDWFRVECTARLGNTEYGRWELDEAAEHEY